LRSLYQRKAALSDANAAALISIATECEAELAGYNQRVMEIVGAARALRRQNAGGQRQAIPPAPAELTALQEKQDQAVLRARDRLEAAFGRDEFLRFEAFVQSFIAPRIRPIEAAGQTSGTH
jgi:hypothetical protein